jgi:hypothetical protein
MNNTRESRAPSQNDQIKKTQHNHPANYNSNESPMPNKFSANLNSSQKPTL